MDNVFQSKDVYESNEKQENPLRHKCIRDYRVGWLVKYVMIVKVFTSRGALISHRICSALRHFESERERSLMGEGGVGLTLCTHY